MIEPTKEQLAEGLRQYPTWGHAYVAEKARADALQEQLDQMGPVRPWLGLATTAELLVELQARAESGGYANYRTVDSE